MEGSVWADIYTADFWADTECGPNSRKCGESCIAAGTPCQSKPKMGTRLAQGAAVAGVFVGIPAFVERAREQAQERNKLGNIGGIISKARQAQANS